MFDVLYATVCGRLTAAPEKRKGKDESVFSTFSLAVNTDKDEVTYVSVISFGYLAENIVPLLEKGDRVTCTGDMKLVPAKEGGKANLRMTLDRIFPGVVKAKPVRTTEEGEVIPPYQSEEGGDEYY